MIKLLFIAHYFPPIGGGGVQRSSKFVKYLPEYEVFPSVLTINTKEANRWSPDDDSLVADIPKETKIFRANWKQGDGDARAKALLEFGARIIQKEGPDLIFVTMSPFQDSRVAAELARKHSLPWIADLRDPWALDEFQVYPTRWHRMLKLRKMGTSLETASAIIMNTPEAERRCRETFPRLSGQVVPCITNGYDEEDFSEPVVEAQERRFFTIVHSGSFHAEYGLRQRKRALEYRLLGRTEPGVEFLSRSHFYLLKALEHWRKAQPGIAGRVRVVCIGAATSTDKALVQQSSVADMFEIRDYMPHVEAVRLVRKADLLFLPLHKLPPGKRATIVPGKTYEYMASQRPILAALPAGDARDFVNAAGTGLACDPDDMNGMVRILKSQFEAWNSGRQTVTWNRSYVERFERRRLTERLAEVLRKVASANRASCAQCVT